MANDAGVTWRSVLAVFWRNWITLLGTSITTSSAFLILGFLAVGFMGIQQSPYVGILLFMILPGVFISGLLLIPVGLWWDKRRQRQAIKRGGERYPTLDFNQPRLRRTVGVVAFLTLVNIFIISTVSYKGVHFMDSVQFCGTVCHTVMEPEYTAYLHSPHSRVKCAECHIGSGAPWFVRSKLSGMSQLFAVTFNTYQHPIPTPVENLRPSRDTCEECHWPERFTGDRMRVITSFQEDEVNTPLQTVLLLHIGGGASEHHGTHSWHVDPELKTTYWTTDPKRQEIQVVRVEHVDGTVKEYVADGVELTPEFYAEAEMREMDCIDCHNRPTHIFHLPDDAMDESMAKGRISPELPFIKQKGVEVLQAAGEQGDPSLIPDTLHAFYKAEYPNLYAERLPEIERAVGEVQAIFSRNVFPKMDVTWGLYPNNIGHTNFPGCFRCHDDSHTTDTGETISQDCTVCHSILAWEEQEPAILQELGIQ
jgi:hypothetical protein